MPIVQVHLIEGRSVEQKRALARRITDAVCETVNTTPDHVQVIITDMAKHDYASGGVLKSDAQK